MKRKHKYNLDRARTRRIETIAETIPRTTNERRQRHVGAACLHIDRIKTKQIKPVSKGEEADGKLTNHEGCEGHKATDSVRWPEPTESVPNYYYYYYDYYDDSLRVLERRKSGIPQCQRSVITVREISVSPRRL